MIRGRNQNTEDHSFLPRRAKTAVTRTRHFNRTNCKRSSSNMTTRRRGSTKTTCPTTTNTPSGGSDKKHHGGAAFLERKRLLLDIVRNTSAERRLDDNQRAANSTKRMTHYIGSNRRGSMSSVSSFSRDPHHRPNTRPATARTRWQWRRRWTSNTMTKALSKRDLLLLKCIKTYANKCTLRESTETSEKRIIKSTDSGVDDNHSNQRTDGRFETRTDLESDSSVTRSSGPIGETRDERRKEEGSRGNEKMNPRERFLSRAIATMPQERTGAQLFGLRALSKPAYISSRDKGRTKPPARGGAEGAAG